MYVKFVEKHLLAEQFFKLTWMRDIQKAQSILVVVAGHFHGVVICLSADMVYRRNDHELFNTKSSLTVLTYN